jgi:hypothetical protein
MAIIWDPIEDDDIRADGYSEGEEHHPCCQCWDCRASAYEPDETV